MCHQNHLRSLTNNSSPRLFYQDGTTMPSPTRALLAILPLPTPPDIVKY